MLAISVKSNIDEARRRFGGIDKEFAFAQVKSLTRVAQATKREITKEMGRVFDRPTPYTLGSLYMRGAKRGHPEAEVWLKDEQDAGKGTAATKYLTPQVYGGRRGLKRFEAALQRIHVLPADMYAVPASGAKLDAWGNMSRGQIVQILAYLSAFGEQGYRANITAARRAKLKLGTATRRGFEYIVIRPEARNLRAGIWERVQTAFGAALRPVLWFVRAPNYRPRLHFFDIAELIYEREFDRLFDEALLENSFRR